MLRMLHMLNECSVAAMLAVAPPRGIRRARFDDHDQALNAWGIAPRHRPVASFAADQTHHDSAISVPPRLEILDRLGQPPVYRIGLPNSVQRILIPIPSAGAIGMMASWPIMPSTPHWRNPSHRSRTLGHMR